jgi:hypothetical protein
MSRLSAASVHVTQIFGQKVDVVKDEAIEWIQLHCFDESDVEERRAIKLFVAVLIDDEDGVIELLLFEKGMDIVEEQFQMQVTVSEADDDRQTLFRSAMFRKPMPSGLQIVSVMILNQGIGEELRLDFDLVQRRIVVRYVEET